MSETEEGRPDETLLVTHEDDPRVVQEQLTEDYVLHVVPLSARLGKLNLNMSVWALLSSANMIVYGALMADTVGTRQAIIGLAASLIVFSVLNWILTSWATRWGLGTAMLSRRVFGTYGAVLTPVLLSLMGIYFAVFEGSVLAVAFQAYFDVLDIRVWYLIVLVALIPLMLGGVQSWMGKLNGVLLPIYAIGLIAAVVAAAIQTDSGATEWLNAAGTAEGSPIPGWLQSFVLYMGLWLFMFLTIDFGRFGKREDLKFNQNVTFGWVFYFLLIIVNGLIGMYLGQTVIPDAGASEANVVLGIIAVLGLFGLIYFVATQVRISSMNFYIASTNLQRVASQLFRVNVSRRVWIVAVAIVAYLLMLTNVFSYLALALQWQGVFFVSWVGIVVTHFVLFPAERRGGPECRPGRVKRIAPGLGVWVFSSVVGIVLTMMPELVPLASIMAPMISLAISVVLYTATVKLLPSPVLNRRTDLRMEVEDPWDCYIECHVCRKSYVAVEMDRDPASNNAAICSACGETQDDYLRAALAESDSLSHGEARADSSKARAD